VETEETMGWNTEILTFLLPAYESMCEV